MKTNHAFPLRAEAKHAFQQRQLPPRIAVLISFLLALTPHSGAPAESSAADELRAAELVESTLFARHAGADELRKMERIYADLVTKYPRDATVRNAHAEFLWSDGERARAVDTWLQAEKLDPTNAVVLDHLGGSYLAAGNAKIAASYYERATSSVPENAAYHYNYANVAYLFRHELLDAAQPDATAMLRHALQHFAQATQLDPLNPEYARAYAETFYTVPEPDWKAALRAWQHFYDITPGKDFALLNLARIHLNLGHKSDARECLAKIQSTQFDRLKKRLLERIDTELGAD